MKVKKVPMRRCIGCMISKPKQECVRICRTPEGEIKADVTGKLNGRGAYLCKDMACFDKMVKAHRLSREFEMQIQEPVYEQLKAELESIISASGGGNIG